MEKRVETNQALCGHTLHETKLSTACGHHHTEKATALLSDEHRVIERVLTVLEKLTKRPVAESLDSWKKTLDFIRGFADGCHHFKEEKVLFPAMEAHGIPTDGGPIGMMLLEHEEGRGYVRSMLAALEEVQTDAAKQTLIDNANSYLRLLKEHIQKEDEILFRMAEEVIPPAEQAVMLRAFEEHEAQEMGTGVHEKYLAIAAELEKTVEQT
jgi:hemerythrin-like domain-containing protein